MAAKSIMAHKLASIALAGALATTGAVGIVTAQALAPTDTGIISASWAKTKVLKSRGIYYPMSAGMYLKSPVFSKGKLTFRTAYLMIDSGRTWKTRYKAQSSKAWPAPVEGVKVVLKTTSKTKYYTCAKNKKPDRFPKNAKKISLRAFKKFVTTKAAPKGKYLANGIYFEVKNGKATNICVALVK